VPRWGEAPRRASPLLVLAALAACAQVRPAPVAAAPTPSPLHLAPLSDLVAAAGLRWIADVRPRRLLADPSLIAPIAAVLPEADLEAMARARGGVDLRAADELVVAGYDGATLFLVHQVVDPARLEAAFAGRVAEVEGRAVDHGGDDPRGVMVRVWGGLGKAHEALVVFGREAAGLSVGGDGPLKAAELFAEARLRRARPAWQAPPLDQVAGLLGEAPIRAAVAGPFRGEWSTGLGGLLGSATGGGVALRPEGESVRVKVVLTGAWGDRAPEAVARLRATFDLLVASGLGRLLGLDRPASPPTFSATPESVALEVRFVVAPLLRGLADATRSQLEAIMRAPKEPLP